MLQIQRKCPLRISFRARLLLRSPIKWNEDYFIVHSGLTAALIGYQAADYVRRQCRGAEQISSAMTESARIVCSRLRRMFVIRLLRRLPEAQLCVAPAQTGFRFLPRSAARPVDTV
jgi:hypothetical protein